MIFQFVDISKGDFLYRQLPGDEVVNVDNLFTIQRRQVEPARFEFRREGKTFYLFERTFRQNRLILKIELTDAPRSSEHIDAIGIHPKNLEQFQHLENFPTNDRDFDYSCLFLGPVGEQAITIIVNGERRNYATGPAATQFFHRYCEERRDIFLSAFHTLMSIIKASDAILRQQSEESIEEYFWQKAKEGIEAFALVEGYSNIITLTLESQHEFDPIWEFFAYRGNLSLLPYILAHMPDNSRESMRDAFIQVYSQAYPRKFISELQYEQEVDLSQYELKIETDFDNAWEDSRSIRLDINNLQGYLRKIGEALSEIEPGLMIKADIQNSTELRNRFYEMEQRFRRFSREGLMEYLASYIYPEVDNQSIRALIVSYHRFVNAETARIARRDIKEFRKLIEQNDIPEPQIQCFLEEHENILKLAFCCQKLHSHIVLEREEAEDLIPDFILEYAQKNCDILDIKLPDKKLIVGRVNRERFSYHVNEAIAQVDNYRRFFQDGTQREAVKREYGIHVYEPNTYVIVGRDENIEKDLKREIEGRYRRDINVLTFDDVLRRCNQVVENIQSQTF